MKVIIVSILTWLWTVSYSQDLSLTIELEGLKNRKGQVVLDIFHGEKGFPMKTEYAVKRQILMLTEDGKLEFIVAKLPVGEYAFALFHDTNLNEKLDVNFLGIPKEGACASNNAKGFMSPPKYSTARFQLQKEMKMKIKMLYF